MLQSEPTQAIFGVVCLRVEAQNVIRQGSRKKIRDGNSLLVFQDPWLPCVENGFMTTERHPQLDQMEWDEDILDGLCNEGIKNWLNKSIFLYVSGLICGIGYSMTRADLLSLQENANLPTKFTNGIVLVAVSQRNADWLVGRPRSNTQQRNTNRSPTNN